MWFFLVLAVKYVYMYQEVFSYISVEFVETLLFIFSMVTEAGKGTEEYESSLKYM